jgi:pilus assembly protein CpaF
MTDTDLVRTICALVADRPGDPAPLVRAEVRRLAPLCTDDERQQLADRAMAHLRGLGELDAYVRDDAVDEVMVNAGRQIWIDRNGSLHHVGELVGGSIDLLIERILAPLGRRVDRSSPIVDARLDDGSRICAVLPPVAVDGATLSIRRFRRQVLPLDAFTNDAGRRLLRELVDRRCNMVVAGATSSGKTSLVAALLDSIDTSERLLVVEDTAELPIHHPHVVRLEARPATADGPTAVDLAQLVRTALRLRPDRLVVGEARGDEVLALVQAMNTGHDGSLSTCHANSPHDALLRLESLVLAAAPTWPLDAIRHQLARSIDTIVQVERRADNTRQVVAISEVVPPDDTARSGPAALRQLAHHDVQRGLIVDRPPTRRRR